MKNVLRALSGKLLSFCYTNRGDRGAPNQDKFGTGQALAPITLKLRRTGEKQCLYGTVAEWLGTALQKLLQRFDPARYLHTSLKLRVASHTIEGFTKCATCSLGRWP